MSKRLTRELVARHAVAACEVERGFELPRWLYITTVALYLAFLAMMAAGLPISEPIFPGFVLDWGLSERTIAALT